MKGLYARQKRQEDLLVKIYVPRDLIEKTEAQMLNAPKGALQKPAWRSAFQGLVQNLLLANEHGRTVDVEDQLSNDLILFQLMAESEDSPPKRKRRAQRRG
jgi:hypothetical protein